MRENLPVSHNVFASCKGDETWTRVEMRVLKAPFNFNEEYLNAIAFCQNELAGNHYKLLRDFWFEDPAEAVLFKLRFG